MTQLSRYPLNKTIKTEILNSFYWLIAHLRKSDEVNKFFNDFLTNTEKLMFAKRLAIALMISKGYSYSEIKHTLKVSTSTIVGIVNWLNKSGDGYKVAFNKLSEKELLDQFWNEVGSIVEYIGKGKRVLPK